MAGKLHCVDGWTITIAQASEMYEIAKTTLDSRIRRGLTLQEAIDMGATKVVKVYTLEDGSKYTLPQAAKEFDVPVYTLQIRIREGMTLDEAVTYVAPSRHKLYSVNGEELTKAEICKKYKKSVPYIDSLLYGKLLSMQEAIDYTPQPMSSKHSSVKHFNFGSTRMHN